MDDSLLCYRVDKQADGTLSGSMQRQQLSDLAAGNVVVRVLYSSINYKDALAATGQSGVAKKFPHVPGIDAAGEVLTSDDPRFRPGDPVLTTGHELGVERWGGWAQRIRVPGDWLIPLPDGLSLTESMILGTAGFTAAQSIQALLKHDVHPEQGDVLVTGGTGGVASLAIMMLTRLKFRVVAVTGKPEQHPFLKSLGAAEVVGREFLTLTPDRPLLSARFAGGIDTVGGEPLASLLKMVRQRGCVACCGLTAGTVLPTTVFPFILRGITLTGIDSVWCPDDERPALWQRMATTWKPEHLASVARPIGFGEIERTVRDMLHGRHVGRSVIDLEQLPPGGSPAP